MSGLGWPADLTDFRLPFAWDGQRIDWHGWHPPIKARALFLCRNNSLLVLAREHAGVGLSKQGLV